MKEDNTQIIIEECGKGCSKYVCSEAFVINMDSGESKNTL